MLTTVVLFTLVSLFTEVMLVSALPKILREDHLAKVCAFVGVLMAAFNLWVGFGTVTGTLTAKLALVAGFALYPIMRVVNRLRGGWLQRAKIRIWMLAR